MTLRAAVVAVSVVATVLAGCGSKSEQAGGKPGDGKAPAAAAAGGAKPGAGGPPMGMPVKASPVEVAAIDLDVQAVGTLLADESVTIRPEIDGRVTELHFQEGQQVAKGARLVSLDQAELKAQLAQSEAQVRTESQRYERARELLAQKFVSEEAVDLARNNLARAEAARREVEARLDKATLVAPFSGTVGLRSISPGAYVRKGDDIVRLESISAIKVNFRIPETYAARVRPGQVVSIRLDAYPGETFAGQVYAVEPVVDERTRTILLRGRVQNSGLKLKPGMFVRVNLAMEKRENAIVIPEPAVWPQGQQTFVYKAVDGKAVLTKVDLGVRRPGKVEVSAGLAPGDVVVTEGQMKLKDGAPIMVLPSQPPAGGPPPKG
jgi:membrane fusion protein (multidrug efflux system)